MEYGTLSIINAQMGASTKEYEEQLQETSLGLLLCMHRQVFKILDLQCLYTVTVFLMIPTLVALGKQEVKRTPHSILYQSYCCLSGERQLKENY
jgi:hypothetical protein